MTRLVNTAPREMAVNVHKCRDTPLLKLLKVQLRIIHKHAHFKEGSEGYVLR